MLLYAVVGLIALAVAGLVYFAGQAVPNSPEMIRRLERLPTGETAGVRERVRRERQAERLNELLSALGSRVRREESKPLKVHRQLAAAGYVGPAAIPVFYGARLVSVIVLGAMFLVSAPAVGGFLGLPTGLTLAVAAWGAALGWVAPTMVVASRAKSRQREILRALPDALDLMVVCVEAGLGLNQAMQRVAEEISLVSPVLGDQMVLLNLEIRAGTPREDALKHLGERTDLDDMRSFCTMLIQTDRFGTSVGQALRTHADVLRTKRRQRVEEASAKTAIKMLFPLVFCIFPAMFIVILGPGVIQAIKVLAGF